MRLPRGQPLSCPKAAANSTSVIAMSEPDAPEYHAQPRSGRLAKRCADSTAATGMLVRQAFSSGLLSQRPGAACRGAGSAARELVATPGAAMPAKRHETPRVVVVALRRSAWLTRPRSRPS
jgi:hypothetical protein